MDARKTLSGIPMLTLLLAAACDVSAPSLPDAVEDAVVADAPVADPGPEEWLPDTGPDLAQDPSGPDLAPADQGVDPGTDAAPADTAPADLAPEDPAAPDLTPVEVVPTDLVTDPGHVPCKDDSACGAGQYCNLPGCATPGTCADKPLACTKELKPVCGCDGNTYGNPCMAAQAGVSVASDGACPTPSCTDNTGCSGSAYCAKESCDGAGTCEPRPLECPAIYAPVCGCDGHDYSNSCAAASAGVNVKYDGKCLVSGCNDNASCPSDQFCAMAACTPPGACTARPGMCTMIYDPVCGCDGKTYGNACSAASAGMNVSHTGECP